MNGASPARRVAGNTGFMGISGLAGKAMHFALLVYLGNELSRAGFGVLGFCLTAALVFAVLADFGLEQYATLVIARNKPHLGTLMRRFLGHRVVVVGVSAIVMAVFLVIFIRGGHAPSVALLSAGYMIALSLVGLVRVFFRGVERMEYEALIGFLEKLLMVLLAFVHLKVVPWPLPASATAENAAVFNILMAFIEADLIVLVLGFVMAVRLAGSLKGTGHAAEGHPTAASGFGAFLREVWPYALGALCITIFYREDTLMLQAMKGEDVVGDYRYAFLLFETLFLFPQTVALAAYPAISAMTGAGQPTRSLLGGLARLFTLVAIPLAVGGFIVGRDLVLLIFPQSVHAPEVWSLLIWALPFVYGSFLFGTALTASGHQKMNLAASAAMALANLVLNLLLIPKWGAAGAAFATAITQGAYSLMLGLACRRIGLEIPFAGTLVRAAAAAVLMGGAVWLVRGRPVFVSIPAGVVVFAGAALLFRATSFREMRLFSAFFRPQATAASGRSPEA